MALHVQLTGAVPTIVVDIRAHASGIPRALCIGADELAGWTGEVLRLARSDLDAAIVVLGTTRAEADRGARELSGAGFARVRAWAVEAGNTPATADPTPRVSAR